MLFGLRGNGAYVYRSIYWKMGHLRRFWYNPKHRKRLFHWLLNQSRKMAANSSYSTFGPYPDPRDFQVLKRPRAQLRLPWQCPPCQRLGHAHQRRLSDIQELQGGVSASPAHLRGTGMVGIWVGVRHGGGVLLIAHDCSACHTGTKLGQSWSIDHVRSPESTFRGRKGA